MAIRKPTLSSAAFILQKRFAAQGIEITRAEALEHAAAMEGFTSYQAYQAHQQALKDEGGQRLVLEGNPPTDYRYVGPHSESVWIRVRNISIQICQKDEGVIVNMYASGLEDEESDYGSYMHYSEAGFSQVERLNSIENADEVDNDYVFKHMKELLKQEGVRLVHQDDGWSWKGKNSKGGPYPKVLMALDAAIEETF